MGTRKRWMKFSFDDIDSSPKTMTKEVIVPKHIQGKSFKSFNFEQRVTPVTVDELAVHTKKINDVELWLKNNVIRKPSDKKSSMLLLTGPTGCGKTITVQVVCRKLGIEVSEWINPVDKHEDFAIGQTAQLLEFLSESKYPSLVCVNMSKVVLIEDFPNSIVRDPNEFISVLKKCQECGSTVIFICTDFSNSKLNLAQTLFPENIKEEYFIHSVSFNAASNTLMKKALKQAQKMVIQTGSFEIPNQSVVDDIISLSMGDIRCAVNQFYFACLQGSEGTSLQSLSSKLNNKRKRKNKHNGTNSQNFLKNERLSFFRCLGRVLNPKREKKNESWRLLCDIEALVDEISIQPSTFNDFIHTNYMKYFGDIDDICNAAELLSFSQLFLNKWEKKADLLQYSLWVPIMALMVHNEHRVSKWNQIVAPKRLLKKTPIYDAELKRLNALDRSYYNIINKCDDIKTLKFRL